jgi:threonine dehydratase
VRRLLADGEGVSGVITQSSGNHGQALAWAAARHGLPCIVVVPENAPAAKRAAIAAYGADIVTCESTMSARLADLYKCTLDSYRIRYL